MRWYVVFFVQAEDGIRDLVRSRGLGDVYKRQVHPIAVPGVHEQVEQRAEERERPEPEPVRAVEGLSLIHI